MKRTIVVQAILLILVVACSSEKAKNKAGEQNAPAKTGQQAKLENFQKGDSLFIGMFAKFGDSETDDSFGSLHILDEKGKVVEFLFERFRAIESHQYCSTI